MSSISWMESMVSRGRMRLHRLYHWQSMDFVNQSLIFVVILADMVFCHFNFRPKGEAKCFAGDVGSIGVAYILLFLIGTLILRTGDITLADFLVGLWCGRLSHDLSAHNVA